MTMTTITDISTALPTDFGIDFRRTGLSDYVSLNSFSSFEDNSNQNFYGHTYEDVITLEYIGDVNTTRRMVLGGTNFVLNQ